MDTNTYVERFQTDIPDTYVVCYSLMGMMALDPTIGGRSVLRATRLGNEVILTTGDHAAFLKLKWPSDVYLTIPVDDFIEAYDTTPFDYEEWANGGNNVLVDRRIVRTCSALLPEMQI